MTRWTCPRCAREFGHVNQSHMCAPAMSVGDYFADRPFGDREVFEAVMAHFDEIGPVLVEAVSVGILIKRAGTFVELRPRRGGLRLSFILSRQVEHPRIARTVRMSRTSPRRAYGVNLAQPEDVDEVVKGWLTAAYFDSPK